MALSGSFNTNAYQDRYYIFSWTATQNQSTNTSTINWTITAAGYGGWVAERTVNLVAGGQTTLAGIREALGLGNTTGALPIANGGT